MAPVQPGQFEQDGVLYHSLVVPSNPKPMEIHYAFVDGYLIVASSKAIATQAIQMHESGESLAKSQKFLASLPPGHSAEASALIYEDVAAVMGAQIRRMPPNVANLFSGFSSNPMPMTLFAYGEPSSIRAVSAGGGVDAGGALVVAAIAIPNLLRARLAANESSAVAAVRTVNTAQIAYHAQYPERGYARNLAMLGPDPDVPNRDSEDHAGLIDSSLGGASCTAGNWCTKSGYRFMVKATCLQSACTQYVVMATPVSASTGTRSFCSASDAVVRVSKEPILTLPITVTQCRRWTPLQ
jgi:type IV pilus assembly protein PilA